MASIERSKTKSASASGGLCPPETLTMGSASSAALAKILGARTATALLYAKKCNICYF